MIFFISFLKDDKIARLFIELHGTTHVLRCITFNVETILRRSRSLFHKIALEKMR